MDVFEITLKFPRDPERVLHLPISLYKFYSWNDKTKKLLCYCFILLLTIDSKYIVNILQEKK